MFRFLICGMIWIGSNTFTQAYPIYKLHNETENQKKNNYNKVRKKIIKNFIPQYTAFFTDYPFDNAILNAHITDYLAQEKRSRIKDISASVVTGIFGAIGALTLGIGIPALISNKIVTHRNHTDRITILESGFGLTTLGVLSITTGAVISIPLYISAKKNRKRTLKNADAIIKIIAPPISPKSP